MRRPTLPLYVRYVYDRPAPGSGTEVIANCSYQIQEGLAVASIARDGPSTLPGDDSFPRARMHRDRNAW